MPSIGQGVIFITGSTDGLGRVVAEEAASTRATVLLHGRDADRGERALGEIRQASGSQRHRLYLADFSSLAQVRRLACEVEAEHGRLDVVINNAGIGPGRPGSSRELSDDGYEQRFQVNYLAPFLLTTLLVPLLRRSAPARVVNVASVGQAGIDFSDPMLEGSYDGWRAYQQSKLAQIMFTLELAARHGGGMAVNALHPASLMNTKMVRDAFLTPMSTVEEGAQATLRLATAPDLEGVSGRTVLRAPAEDLPFDDATFDTVVSTLVLCGVDDQPPSVREIRRILRPGGRFLLIEHVRSEDDKLARGQDRINWFNPADDELRLQPTDAADPETGRLRRRRRRARGPTEVAVVRSPDDRRPCHPAGRRARFLTTPERRPA